MFKPSQYEDIQKSTIVLGADVLYKLKKRDYNIEDLFKEIKTKKNVSINQFLRTCWEIKFGKICHPPNNDLKVS